jgi:hypothetical protein
MAVQHTDMVMHNLTCDPNLWILDGKAAGIVIGFVSRTLFSCTLLKHRSDSVPSRKSSNWIGGTNKAITYHRSMMMICTLSTARNLVICDQITFMLTLT